MSYFITCIDCIFHIQNVWCPVFRVYKIGTCAPADKLWSLHSWGFSAFCLPTHQIITISTLRSGSWLFDKLFSYHHMLDDSAMRIFFCFLCAELRIASPQCIAFYFRNGIWENRTSVKNTPIFTIMTCEKRKSRVLFA